MENKPAFAFIALGLSAAAFPGEAQDVTLEKSPPVVVQTEPRAGDAGVPADTKQIRVTFSKAMKTKQMWSVMIVTKESFPKIVGPIGYQTDHRTFVMPVALEPGRTYALWLNSAKGNNFQDTLGQSAVPYLLVFKTKK
jgi:RNA polymerase sigma-70 factor (ECF subfamily)